LTQSRSDLTENTKQKDGHAAVVAETNPADAMPPLSDLRQPAWHLLVLSATTFMLYDVYWCFKTWRLLSKYSDSLPEIKGLSKFLPNGQASFKQASPWWRTLALLIPVLQNYVLFTLALGIARRVPKEDEDGHDRYVAQHPIISALVMCIVLSALCQLARLPGSAYLLCLSTALPLAIMQHWLNQYWDKVEEPGKIMRHGFSFMELVTVIIGALCLGGIGASFILGANK